MENGRVRYGTVLWINSEPLLYINIEKKIKFLIIYDKIQINAATKKYFVMHENKKETSGTR